MKVVLSRVASIHDSHEKENSSKKRVYQMRERSKGKNNGSRKAGAGKGSVGDRRGGGRGGGEDNDSDWSFKDTDSDGSNSESNQKVRRKKMVKELVITHKHINNSSSSSSLDPIISPLKDGIKSSSSSQVPADESDITLSGSFRSPPTPKIFQEPQPTNEEILKNKREKKLSNLEKTNVLLERMLKLNEAGSLEFNDVKKLFEENVYEQIDLMKLLNNDC